jgi:hypothetical protein
MFAPARTLLALLVSISPRALGRSVIQRLLSRSLRLARRLLSLGDWGVSSGDQREWTRPTASILVTIAQRPDQIREFLRITRAFGVVIVFFGDSWIGMMHQCTAETRLVPGMNSAC